MQGPNDGLPKFRCMWSDFRTSPPALIITSAFLHARRWCKRRLPPGSALSHCTALLSPASMIVEAPQAYAMAAGGFFVALLLIRTRNRVKACFEFTHRSALRHLVYPQVIRRRRFIGPWTRANVLTQLLFLAANAFCISFRATSIRDAGTRAAHLSLINLIPAYGGPHLSFLADVFGVSLSAFRLIHRSAGAMSLPLLIFHVGVSMATRIPFPLRAAENMWGLVVCLFRPFLSLPSARCVAGS